MLSRENCTASEASIDMQPQIVSLADVSNLVQIVECAKHLRMRERFSIKIVENFQN